MTTMPSQVARAEAEAAIAAHGFWYHVLEVAPGVTTSGWFDLRPIVDLMPWPDVRDKRCLDVGPYDGFLSFELERRGAAEVVATDIARPADWDWPIANQDSGPEAFAAITGGEPGKGLEIARDLLGSKVDRREVSVYDLTPDRVGRFDVVVCGSLMLHLKDPIRALEAIRSVCDDAFMSSETVTRLALQGSAAEFRAGKNCQWWVPTPAGHLAMLESAGFEVERSTEPYEIPLGPGHPSLQRQAESTSRPWRRSPAVPDGVLHAAALCRPANLSSG